MSEEAERKLEILREAKSLIFEELSAERLSSLYVGFEFLAIRNARVYLREIKDNFKPSELRAAVKMEQLKLTYDSDIAEIIMRSILIREIQENDLWAKSPVGFMQFEEALSWCGVSEEAAKKALSIPKITIAHPYSASVQLDPMSDYILLGISETEKHGRSTYWSDYGGWTPFTYEASVYKPKDPYIIKSMMDAVYVTHPDYVVEN